MGEERHVERVGDGGKWRATCAISHAHEKSGHAAQRGGSKRARKRSPSPPPPTSLSPRPLLSLSLSNISLFCQKVKPSATVLHELPEPERRAETEGCT